MAYEPPADESWTTAIRTWIKEKLRDAAVSLVIMVGIVAVVFSTAPFLPNARDDSDADGRDATPVVVARANSPDEAKHIALPKVKSKKLGRFGAFFQRLRGER
jgi:hypothetical protein